MNAYPKDKEKGRGIEDTCRHAVTKAQVPTLTLRDTQLDIAEVVQTSKLVFV